MASPAVTPAKAGVQKARSQAIGKGEWILGSWIPASAGMTVVGLDIHAIALIFEARSCPGSFDGGTRKDTQVCPCALTARSLPPRADFPGLPKADFPAHQGRAFYPPRVRMGRMAAQDGRLVGSRLRADFFVFRAILGHFGPFRIWNRGWAAVQRAQFRAGAPANSYLYVRKKVAHIPEFPGRFGPFWATGGLAPAKAEAPPRALAPEVCLRRIPLPWRERGRQGNRALSNCHSEPFGPAQGELRRRV